MKQKENAAILKRALRYLLPYKKAFVVVGLTLVLSTVIGFLQPLVIQRITDSGMMQQDMGVIVTSALFLAVLVLGNQAIDLLQTRIFADVHNASYYTIFHQVFEKLLHLKKSYFEDKNSAEILSFLQMDVSQVSSITDRYTVLSVSYVFRILSGLIGLFLISWPLALVVLCMVPVKFLLVRGLSKRQEKAMDEMIESSRDFSRWFGDDLNGVDEIKLWDLFQSRDKVFREKQEKVLQVEKKSTMIGSRNTFWEVLLEWSVTIFLYILGGWLICTGTLTIGAVFAFVSYSGYVTGPVSALINLKMYFARIFPSARRLFQFLDMETEPDTGTQPLQRLGAGVRLRFHVQKLEQPPGGGEDPGKIHLQVDQGGDRPRHIAGVAHKGEHRPDGQRSCADQPASQNVQKNGHTPLQKHFPKGVPASDHGGLFLHLQHLLLFLSEHLVPALKQIPQLDLVHAV